MKLTNAALALALAVCAAPAAAQYDRPSPPPPPRIPETLSNPGRGEETQAPAPKDGSPRPSAKALKPIVELQKAVNANDTANIPAKLAAAQAVASTKEDRYIIAQLQLKAAYAANDDTALAGAIDAITASGYVNNSATMADLYVALGSKLYNAKKFDAAATAFEHASTLNPSNSQALVNLAESRFSSGRKADAVALFQRAIQLRTAAGQKPEEALYKRALGIAYGEQMPATADLARQWVTAYPSPDSWRNALAIYQNLNKPDVEGALDVLRLMRATGSLSNPSDFSLYASAAADQLNYNEAQAVIDEGLAAKRFEASNPLLKDIITGLRAKPKATDADLAEASKTAKSGMALLRIGDRHYGLGQYAKAVELYRQSMGKPGVDSSLANMHLGMALARSGDKAGATAAFNAVSGNLSGIAKYWLIYVQQQA
ncbi:MAG TPA: tetratricopeptide repeat protein, partial [Sphingomicrobium sp.]|nr:tetratricopeptide repeat protein [Sphingomicrobium sp.]